MRPIEILYAGDGGAFKPCTRCDEVKPLMSFNVKSSSTDGKKSFCRICQCKEQKQYSQENTELLMEKQRKWRAENPEKRKELSRRNSRKRRENGTLKIYEEATREIQSLRIKRWWENNRHKRKEYNDKQVSTGKGKLEAAIRSCVRSEIVNGSKGGRKTFDLLGYSTDELMRHLESQFLEGMSWENYGRGGWHVDHIKPLSSFEYETPDDPQFKIAWSLSNLQPLWQFDNLSKGAKIQRERVSECVMLY